MLLLLYIIGFPLTVLIHETGHALAIICSAKNGVAKVYLGDFKDSNKESFRLGRIHYHIEWGIAGICYRSNPKYITTFQSVMISLGGTLITAIFTIILFIFFHYHLFNGYIHFLITGMFWMNLLQFVSTIIPVVYPGWMGAYSGMQSDGYRVLSVLRKKEG
ncbi:hypothetical protein [Oceanobacillus locisalsi]|uniref:Peptidase M50 domain-containing protein n=1 Tax=Oceanobacillus locisalsi TaxID=546107 RepID=A0ABW3NJP5_9BACI